MQDDKEIKDISKSKNKKDLSCKQDILHNINLLIKNKSQKQLFSYITLLKKL